MSESSVHSPRERRVQELIAEFLDAEAEGRAPTSEAWLGEHPEFAAELREFLAFHRRLGELGRPLRDAGPAACEQRTMLSGSSDESPPAPLGTIRYFGDYELLEEIARGGMGVVYRANQVKLRRTVAVKMILAGQLAGAEDVRRFQTEARAAARLHHPNIVSIHEVGEQDGQHYFSMDYIEGESLARRITQGPLPPRDAAALVETVSRAVSFAHVENVIHRDLKPANILLDRRGGPHVTDFGLAKQTAAEEASTASLTATGQVLGTPSYMAPEQAAGKTQEIGPHSDVYSLGAVLYCALTGRPPFQAASTLDTLLQVLNREPVSPRALNPAVPRDLETICLKCLEKDSRRRYASAQELANELRRFLDGRPILARPIGPVARSWRWCRRNPVVAGLSAALVLALAGSSVIFSSLASRAVHEANVSKGLMIQAKNLEGQATREAERATRNERTMERHLYSAHMHLALQEYRNNGLRRARELLEQHVPAAGREDLRSFEWRHLHWLINRQQKTIPLAPGEPAALAAVSPNGRYVALGNHKGSLGLHRVRLWDLVAGKLVLTIVGKPEPALEGKETDALYQQPVFSPDSSRLAVIAWDYPMVWHQSGNGRWGARERKSPRVMVWDLATLKPRTTIPLPEYKDDGWGDTPYHIAVSAGHVAVAPRQASEGKGTVKIWDIPKAGEISSDPGRVLAQRELISGHPGNASIQFTPDQQSVAWANVFAGKLDLTTVAAEPKTTTIPVQPSGVALSPDGKYFASGTYLWNEPWGRPVVHLYEAGTGKVLYTFPVATARNNVFENFIRFSPDSRTLAIARELSLEVWDIESKQQIGNIAHAEILTGIGFSDNRTLFSVAADNVVRFWNVATQPGPDTLSLGKGPVRTAPSYASEMPFGTIASIAIDPGGRFFATIWSSLPRGPEARVVLLYDLAPGSEGKPIGELPPAKFFNAEGIAFSRDSQWLAVAGDGPYEKLGNERFVQLWRVSRGAGGLEAKLHRTIPAIRQVNPSSPSIALSPAGTKLAYPDCRWALDKSGNGSLRTAERLQIHDVASGKSFQVPLGVATADPVAFQAAPAESWFADSQGLIGFEHWEGTCSGALFSVDGRRVFMVQDRHTTPWQACCIAWDAETGQLVSAFEMATPPQLMILSSDGNTLATAHADRSVQLWDVSEDALRDVRARISQRARDVRNGRIPSLTEPAAKPRLVIGGLADHISAIAFAPDGKSLATASGDRMIRLWDLVTGEERLTLEGHARDIKALVFLADGRGLVSGDSAGIVNLWRAAR